MGEERRKRWTSVQIKLLLATNRIARSVYILGKGGPTDVYTNRDTAYKLTPLSVHLK
jgi:hypothetical protein